MRSSAPAHEQSPAASVASSAHHQLRIHLAVLLMYLVLATLLTYPLAAHLTTHVPGDGRDDPPLVWNLWWVRYALLDLRTNPLICTYMFYPVGINLTFFTLTILNGLLSIPLQLTAGVVLASNANLLFSYAMAAFGTYLLALYLLRQRTGEQRALLHVAAFIAGLVFAFAPIKMIFASLGQFNMASTHWMPFFVLYVVRAMTPHEAISGRLQGDHHSVRGGRALLSALFPSSDRRRQRDAVLAGLFLLFTAYAEFTFASFLLIFLVVYLLYLLLRRPWPLPWGAVLGRLSLIGAVFLAGFWPILASMVREMRIEGDYSLSAGWGFADIFAADLLGFFVPSHLHPFFGAWAQTLTRSFSYTNFAYVGFAVLALALVALWCRQQSRKRALVPSLRFWGLSALLYAILSLGPVLHINGRWVFDLDGLLVRVGLPFIILHYIPFIKANRYPSRLQVLVVLCLSVLVAFGTVALLQRAKTWARSGWTRPVTGALAILLTGVILFEYLAVPLPLSDMRVPEVYHRIAADNGHAPVLQLPISWRNSFQFIPQKFTELPLNVNTVVMFQQFYQTVHQGPILSGNTSRNPEAKITYFLEAPVIRSIVALEEGRTLSPEQIAADRAAAPEVLRLLGFRYVVLHPPLSGGPVEDYVRSVLPVEPIPADPGLSAYRLRSQEAEQRLTIDMGSDLSRLYTAEGWGEPQSTATGDGRVFRWSFRPDARLLFSLPKPGALKLSLYLLSPHYEGRIAVRLNGRTIAHISPPWNRWTTIDVAVPASATQAGLNVLVLQPDRMLPLPNYSETPFQVAGTGVHTAMNIVAHSAGLDAGGDLGFAHIYVNGKDVIAGRRGLNVAVIDPRQERVMRTASFDLVADASAGARLADFISSTPPGQIVAVAVMDDASLAFNDAALTALRSIGASTDLRGKFRNSYAAIGVRGAAPGQALEQWAQGRPASVAVGAHVFGRALGVAVSSVTIQRLD